jgi:hypothetical protein
VNARARYCIKTGSGKEARNRSHDGQSRLPKGDKRAIAQVVHSHALAYFSKSGAGMFKEYAYVKEKRIVLRMSM